MVAKRGWRNQGISGSDRFTAILSEFALLMTIVWCSKVSAMCGHCDGFLKRRRVSSSKVNSLSSIYTHQVAAVPLEQLSQCLSAGVVWAFSEHEPERPDHWDSMVRRVDARPFP